MSEEVNKIDQFTGPMFLNLFYSIYFPAYIFALLIGLFFGNTIIGTLTGKSGDLFDPDPSISQQYVINLYMTLSIVFPIILAIATDYRMKSMRINYAPSVGKRGYLGTWFYIMMGLGFFFFVQIVLSTLFVAWRGPTVIFRTQNLVTSPDFFLKFIYTTISPDENAKIERFLIFGGLFCTYVGIEFLLRGLLTNYSRVAKLGFGSAVLISGLIQAVAFSNVLQVFPHWDSYLYVVIVNFFWGLTAAILWWRTKNFWAPVIYSIMSNLLLPSSVFRRVLFDIINLTIDEFSFLPIPGNIVTQIQTAFEFLRIALIVLTIPSIFLGFQEVFVIIRTLYKDFRRQSKGIFIVGASFIVIDLIFSLFVSGQNPLGLFVGFFLAMIVLRIVLPIVYRFLDHPTPISLQALASGGFMDDPKNLNEVFPLNVTEDIRIIEGKGWKMNPRIAGISSGLLYIYLLFVTATYRQLERLGLEEIIRFTIFLVSMPAIGFGLGTYFWTRAIERGYFFSKPWRRWLDLILLILTSVLISLWTVSSSQVNFHWAYIPLFFPYALTIWPSKIRDPGTEYAFGLGQYGRRRTFMWVESNENNRFSAAFEELTEHPHEKVVSGVYLLAAKLGLKAESDYVDMLKDKDLPRGKLVGAILGLGLIGSFKSEGILLDLLANPDLEVRKACYWALGRIGTREALGRMVSILESNPNPALVPLAEEAILKIDPNYPLAGVRDNLSISLG